LSELVVLSKEFIVDIRTFLGCDASIIALLKGVEKEGKCPFSEESPIQSTGG